MVEGLLSTGPTPSSLCPKSSLIVYKSLGKYPSNCLEVQFCSEKPVPVAGEKPAGVWENINYVSR